MEIDEVVFHEPRQELGHELAEDVTVSLRKSLRR